ncbi:ABC transporter ATP-binding protein [Treponema sp. OMZ 792]|uniref:ABC transporter ATP-binding protein n=1 Tax=unclassified Treponema TaxID=2638727 RepID=UPI0020A2CEDE|nr:MULTISPECIES: ABC transporter ATP-binding protein [unclassified Treponema]UTC74507.1 ABC transporter ATP-binding protein [Treponema sp. OMZ 792]UTC80903.1 ABC transporter ATP-binding protein [Treponema sp. OMZ 798]
MFKFLKTWYMVLYLVLQALSTALEVGVSYVMMLAIDYATNGTIEKLHLYLIGTVAYLLISFLVGILTTRVREKAGAQAVFSLREALMKKILTMSTGEYASRNSGSYVAFLTKNVEKLEESYFWTIFRIYPSFLQLVVSVIWLSIMDWRLSLFVLFTGLIQLIVPKFTVKPVAKAERDYIERGENYTITLKEVFSAFDLIKSYNLQEKIEILHRNANTGYKKASFKDMCMNGFMGSLGDLLSNITYIGVFFLGAVLVLLGFFKISVIIAASQLVVFIVYPLSNLTRYITSLLASKAVIKDLDEILNMEEKDGSFKDVEAKTSFEDSISFENMSFSYPQDDEDEEDEENRGVFPALKNINLSVKKGEKVLIVGESGSGKSTLLSLLYKKFTGYEGLIKIDGTDIRKIPDASYFKLVSVVHQSPFIFDDTIKNNIALYNEEISDERIKDACKKAGLQRFIDGLPLGLETRIGEGASKISGGEKQRIAIARALVKDSPILLMDEATSALDKETSAEIENTVLSQKELTCIIISHHVSEALKARADKIITVKDGSADI